MTDAKRDNNQIPTMLATDKDDGTTPVAIKADPTMHEVLFSNGDTGSDVGNNDSVRDDNSVPAISAVSSADGETPIPIFADASTGAILVKTT